MATSIQPDSVSAKLAPSKGELREVRRCLQCGDYLIATPLLQCSHGHILPLRCFWYSKGKAVYAECLDLDIMTKGATPEEAIGRLQEDMYWYVQTVLSGGSSEGLIPRPAPWQSWVRYYLHLSYCRLRGLFSGHDKDDSHTITALGVNRLSRC